MKFLHVGDVHLGAEPESGTGLGPVRKAELWEAFRDIIDICERERVDLLLLPGDVFHGQPLLREVKELDAMFRELSHTRVVMCAGNHDCLLPSSHYYDITFPEHVSFLMDSRSDSVYLPVLNTQVSGLSYETRQIAEARYDVLHAENPQYINILLAHGNVLCNDKSIPIHKGILETAGFDYIALGHLHNRIELGSRMAYSGSLEPLNRGETGEKGYIIGEISKAGIAPAKVQWKFVPHARRQYIPLEFEVTTEHTELSLCSGLFASMQEQGLQHLYLVTLTGIRGREIVWNTEAILSLLNKRGANVIEVCDKTVPDFPIEQLRKEQQENLVGRFIRKMDEVEEEQLRSMALQYGLQALLARDERT